MADVAVEKNDTPVEKVVTEEVDAKKDAAAVDVVEKSPATANGAADAAVADDDTDAPVTKENGASNSAAASEDAAAEETPAAVVEAVAVAADKSEESSEPAEAVAAEENGDKKVASAEAAEEANGDSTDSVPAEAVKRKVAADVVDDKSDETAATPEKKAKLDEATKEDVQNGSEATDVAA